MPIKLIAFDLDGTLVDSASDIARAVDQALQTLGQRSYGVTEVQGWVGEGLTKLLKRALTGRMDGEPDPDLLDRARTEFRRFYTAGICVDSRLYPGAAEALAALTGRYVLACVTNKSAEYTGPLLKALGVQTYFRVVVSGDTVPALKPDPRPLLLAASECGVVPGECCMVGDSRIDVQAARAAGFRPVGVSYGYHQGEDLQALGAEAVLDSLAELPTWLASAQGAGLRSPPRQ